MKPRRNLGDADLVATNVTKRFGAICAVDAVSFSIAHGEIVALLGPSGSGKTTLLAMIGGQIRPDDGDIAIGGRSIVGLPPDKIATATVFQDYALFPHMSVAENVAFGLQMRGVPKAEVHARLERMLDLVQLKGYGARKVTELSGGQRQRVATARSLIVEPKVVLMDEPLGALDRQIRLHMQQELHDLLHRLKATTLVVTHDQQEAFAMADRVVVMNKGRIEQIDTVSNLYRTPRTEFVATFLGDGVLLDATVRGQEGLQPVVEIAGAQLRSRGEATVGSKVRLLIRPEDVLLGDPSDDQALWKDVQVVRAFHGGELTRYSLALKEYRLSAIELGSGRYAQGDVVSVSLRPDAPYIVPAAMSC